MVDGNISYCFFAHVLPAWRDEGIRRATVQFNENRLRAIAATHPNNGRRWLSGWATETEIHWENLLLSQGYKPIRYFMKMVRPSLDNIPDRPRPDGLEVRRGTHAEWRQIWEAMCEAFQDHWGETDLCGDPGASKVQPNRRRNFTVLNGGDPS